MDIKKGLILLCATAIGIACFYTGQQLSARRPLWNDELYTYKQSIVPVSYQEILQGKIVEGNNAPLFYWCEKFFANATRVKLQSEWKGEWFFHDRPAQVKLRFFSNICLSLAVAMMFYFLGVQFSLGFAALCVGVFLSTPLVWLYWIEARPYALWIFLTVVQSILLIRIMMKIKQEKSGPDGVLLAVNLLLSLTIAIGAVQSLISYAALWMMDKSRWMRCAFFTAITVGIAGFYYQQSPKFKFWFADGPMQLILDNVPLEFWVLGMICAAIVFLNSTSFFKDEQNSPRSYYPFAGMIILVAGALLMYLRMHAGNGTEGFALSSRYFLFLIPVVSFGLASLIRDVWKILKNDPWMRMNLILGVGGLLLLRGYKTYVHLLGSGTFVHLIQ